MTGCSFRCFFLIPGSLSIYSVCWQNSSRTRSGLVTTRSDAEEALRLHEDHHQQEGTAQVCGTRQQMDNFEFDASQWQWLWQGNKLNSICNADSAELLSRVCSEFYEANALMMEEEGAVIAGLLVGLNVIDANLCMKGEDLDSQVSHSHWRHTRKRVKTVVKTTTPMIPCCFTTSPNSVFCFGSDGDVQSYICFPLFCSLI